MNKWTKGILIAAGCLGAAGLILTGAGLALGGFQVSAADVQQENPQAYTETFSPEGIRSLEIEWVGGKVTVEPWDGEQIQITESAAGGMDKRDRMDCRREGDSLEIRYVRSGIRFGTPFEGKQLEIRIPKALAEALPELEIENVSASVVLRDLNIRELDVNTVSGPLTAENLRTGSLDFESVSGNLIAALPEAPREMDLETMSGDAELTLPKDASVRTEFETVSGQLNSQLPTGTGSLIEMESVSGDLTILAAE